MARQWDMTLIMTLIMHGTQYGSRRVAIVRPYRHISPASSSNTPSPMPSDISMDTEEDWPIHTGYLNVTLAQVACETQSAQLQQWLDLFSPSAQPQSNEEHFYVNTMNAAIQDKLASLE